MMGQRRLLDGPVMLIEHVFGEAETAHVFK